MQNYLKLGDWNAICDSCGRKFKASTMRKRWDGMFVCKEDFEYKHPQLSLRVRGDKQSIPIPRPDAIVDTFLPDPNGITTEINQTTADIFYSGYDFLLTETGSILFTET